MTEQYMERTAVFCTAVELKALAVLSTPPTPTARLVSEVHACALRHHLPVLAEGHYGIDLTTGEFLRTVV